MRKSFYLQVLLVLICTGPSLWGQGGFVPPLDQLVNIPSSPEASAFAAYGNTPVSQFTGSPGVNIPLASVSGRSLTIPVTLTYNSGGIKVEQIANWVGLGWNVNVGGAISRQVNGLPDDYTAATPAYYPHYSTESPSWTSGGSQDMVDYIDYFRQNTMTSAAHKEDTIDSYPHFIEDYNNSLIDTQPDIFSFSAMGLSGNLVVDYPNGQAYCLEHPEYKVTVSLGAASSARKGSKTLNSWTITDNFGNKLTFGNPEKTNLITDSNEDPDHKRDYHSAWYLTEYRSANSRDVVTFTYSAEQEFTNLENLPATQSLVYGGQPSTGYAPELKIFKKELVSVSVNGKKRLEFHEAGSRTDLPGMHILDKIEVFDHNEVSVDMIDFIHSYFDDGVSDGTDPYYELRLRLDAVEVLGKNSQATTTSLKKRHDFDYFGNGSMPSRISLAQDSWGYFNNQTSNSNLIPSHATYNSQGANRNPSYSHAQQGSLQKITYPTGGTTEFFYRSNYLNGSVTGGLRVYKIEDRPDANSVAQTRYFYYDKLDYTNLSSLDDDFFKNSTASSGVAQYPGDHILYRDTKDRNGNTTTNGQVILFASLLHKPRANIVTYTHVTEVQFDGTNQNGFTEYEFYNDDTSSPIYPVSNFRTNGMIKEVNIYDKNFVRVQKKAYDYSTTEIIKSFIGYDLQSTLYQEYNGLKAGSGSAHYVNYTFMLLDQNDELIQCSGADCLFPGPTNVYSSRQYTMHQKKLELEQETVTNYDGLYELTSTTDYTYHTGSSPTHYEVVTTETYDSEGTNMYTKLEYAADLTGSPYTSMVTANQMGQVIKTTLRKGGASGTIIQQQETVYATFSGAHLPSEVKYASNGGSLETRIEYDSYDSNSNPLGLSKDGVQNIQYLWDINKSLPTATVSGTLNGTSNTVFAYTSFETTEKGNWTYSGATSSATDGPSGEDKYNLNGGSISKGGLTTSKSYIVGFWAKGTGSVKIDKTLSTTTTSETQAVTSTWTYYEFEVRNIDTITILENAGADNIDIDEVRLFQKGSQMTTYAYDGRGLVLSQIGPNGIPIHYEYDMHGRLIRVKDHEHNTVRLMEYEYKNTTPSN